MGSETAKAGKGNATQMPCNRRIRIQQVREKELSCLIVKKRSKSHAGKPSAKKGLLIFSFLLSIFFIYFTISNMD